MTARLFLPYKVKSIVKAVRAKREVNVSIELLIIT